MILFDNFISNRRGSTATIFAISLPVFIGGLALMVETGHWWYLKTKLQATADMAAIAGARELMMTENYTQIRKASLGDAYENGFDVSKGSLFLKTPPETGRYTGYRGVEVNLVEDRPRLLTSFFSDEPVKIAARAVALALEPQGEACILSLDRSHSTSIEVSGTADINVTGCEVKANSNGPYSVNTNGSGQITADCVRTAGNIGANQNITVKVCDQPSENERPITDPYADLFVPDGVNAMPCETPKKTGKWSLSLVSGRYCKSNVIGNDLIELESGGTFIFDGVNLNLKSSFAHLKGTGVTLIFMNGGRFIDANGGRIELTAQSDGPYEGIVMFSDRLTSNPDDVIKFSGNQNTKIEGVLYFPVQSIEYAGGATSLSECTILIAHQIELTGNSAMTNKDCGRLGVRDIGGTDGGVALYE